MDFTSLVRRHREFYESGATAPIPARREALRRLQRSITLREEEIVAALHADLRKPRHEALASEVCFVRSEIAHALRYLDRWARPDRRRSPRMAWPARASVVPEPRGVALVMGPWNYPFQLLLLPLVGALAAGNCALLKTSEFAPRSAEVVERVVRDALEPGHVSVVHGDRAAAQELLHERFDAIFFTGASRAGREVMAAAARHLTPVVMELGGKCPCIVCDDADIGVAARRIAWGKWMNAGQTCVAPDYLLVDARRHDELLAALKAAIARLYSVDPRHSPDYGRIVNRPHFERLRGYLADGDVAFGGGADAGDLYVEPTLLTGVKAGAAVMTEEIFGPILPVLPFNSLDAALAIVRALPPPLAAYAFTADRHAQQLVVREVRAGGVCVNDVVVQLFGKDLPFGGVGESGLGSYHGKASFDAFSHYKTVLRRRTWPEFSWRYPPVRLAPGPFKRALEFLLRI